MNTLSDTRYLVIHSTMQGMRLDNDKRDETMNGYFAKSSEGDVVQLSEI